MPELRWILIIVGAAILLAVYLWGRRISPRAEEKGAILRSRAEPLISTSSYESPTDEPTFDATAELDASDAIDDDEPEIPVAFDEEPTRIEPVFTDEPFAIDVDDEPTITPEEQLAADAASAASEPVSRGMEPVISSEAPPAAVAAPAPAATSARRSRTPTPRKIVVLRLAAGQSRIAGDKLRQAFAAQGLSHGKYDIYHYYHTDGSTLFSVASMVEPGSFDPAQMDTTPYPGVTLFAQLPASISALDVLEELLRNAKALQSAVGGTLQDERGGLLNSPRIQRLRQEVVDFEHLCDAQTDEPTDAPLTSS